MQIIAACGYGLDDIVAGELKELGFSFRPGRDSGIEIMNAGPEDVVRLNLFTRTVSRVYILIARADVQSLEDINDFCATIPYSQWFDAGQPFAVRGKREGKHDFTSMDMARDVGSSVVGHFQKVNAKRIPVDLDNPEIEIHAVLKGTRFELLLNTSGRPLEYRYQRPFQHFAPIKPTIAAAMLRLSSYTGIGTLLDPMAGSGTIALEAIFKTANIVPGMFRDQNEYLFDQLHFIDPGIWKSQLETARNGVIDNPGIKVLAADRFRKNVDGMIRNFRHFGVESHITAIQGLAETLDYIDRGDFDCIVTNPPYGMRIGSVKLTEQLYRNFAKACASKQSREVIALTPLKKTWIRSFMENGYSISHSRLTQYGNLHVNILKAVLE